MKEEIINTETRYNKGEITNKKKYEYRRNQKYHIK